MKWLKIVSGSVLIIILGLFAFVYFTMRASLPELSGDVETTYLTANGSLARDSLGAAVVTADNEYDAAYLLGYAHAQDRLFQMDLMRRQSAGELSELFGERALGIDKNHRFHQFKKRAKVIFENSDERQKRLITAYANGVNDGAESLGAKPVEYYLTGGEFAPWEPEDTLLATFSMYLDLQRGQTEIDFSLTALKRLYGDQMVEFVTLPSPYQAAIDYSVIPSPRPQVPILATKQQLQEGGSGEQQSDTGAGLIQTYETADIGSNNWAVSSELTNDDGAMVSVDMHLGLRVPSVWYRAQLNYNKDGRPVQVTGVSLPGTPGIIAGSNGHIAWGFTNSNVDNVDWIKLNDDTATTSRKETIMVGEEAREFTFEDSEYGPVRELDGEKYALKWVAHQPYALNMDVTGFSTAKDVDEALEVARNVRMPVQNMVVADAKGDVAWRLTGAITARTPLYRHAITEAEYDPLWQQNEPNSEYVVRPSNHRVLTANARVVGTEALKRYGDGGYALGARQHQIMTLLNQQDKFNEQDFYDIQLDNQAIFLGPWHTLLTQTLSESPQKYADDLRYLESWKACACPESVGYTLVRRFRSEVINQVMKPIVDELKTHDAQGWAVTRTIEPAIWAIINDKSESWLPKPNKDYQTFLTSAYDVTLEKLQERHADGTNDYEALRWGNVNALRVEHPFASSLGPFKSMFNMPTVEGFGDSYLPAAQGNAFGASERFIARPGDLQSAIMTVPGGQSGHVLSNYYKAGFDDYAQQKSTPFLPGPLQHKLNFKVADK